ncbi:hypothetical protein VPH35_138018 [Triticum aestivum]
MLALRKKRVKSDGRVPPLEVPERPSLHGPLSGVQDRQGKDKPLIHLGRMRGRILGVNLNVCMCVLDFGRAFNWTLRQSWGHDRLDEEAAGEDLATAGAEPDMSLGSRR